MGSVVSSKAPLVSVNDVSFNFGITKVLLDVTFSINSGDFIIRLGNDGPEVCLITERNRRSRQ